MQSLYPKRAKQTKSPIHSISTIKITPFVTKRDKKALITNDNFIMYYQKDLSTGDKRYIYKEYNSQLRCKSMLTLNNNITQIINKHNHSGNYEEC
jgi:hypothetical protein